jgi:uncharacterized protein (DUF1684 family)
MWRTPATSPYSLDATGVVVLGETEELWDWRQQVAGLYHDVRCNRDAAAAWRHWCATRAALFRTHPQSPIEPSVRAAFEAPGMFAYDPALRLEVRLAPAAAERLALPTGADGTTAMRAFARTSGLRERLGGELTLYWIEGYGGGVFLPFADDTNGTQTYGGGRYLLDTIKGADLGAVRPDGTLLLDFNFSYFPSCAYSSRYVCPLAPPGNRLPGAVRAGERL